MSDKTCDLAITGGMVIDGTGKPRFKADLAVAGDRIVALGDISAYRAKRTVDATGRIVAPGFIDAHTHDDNLLLRHPDMAPKTSQGVTTVVIGNCGVSLAPIALDRAPPPPMDLLGGQSDYHFGSVADYAAHLKSNPPSTNFAMLVGHSTLRVGAMDDLARPARPNEIARMEARLDEGMRAGAIGFSTGLFYPTNSAAPTEEVIALAKIAASHGGVYTTHMRNEHDGVETSLDETFRIGREANIPVVISHHKVAGVKNFGRSKATLAKIEAARATQTIGLDVYPYTAGSTVLLDAFIPSAARVIITWSKAHPELTGRDLAAIAKDWGVELLEAAKRLQPAGAIYFMMDEADVQRIMAYPHSMIGSDGLPHDEHPHPRLWGTFPRVLGHYARDIGLLTLEDAVHRMTGLTAQTFGFKDRGEIRLGAYADLVVFDAATIAARADFDHPKEPAAGIDHVIVNGETVWRQGRATEGRPGTVVRRVGG
ncbi:MAG: D-aminoacylase [Alphaproteobacteria bacterium]|nr:D-aminoacylase [Alphaproteobacteria bacterium]